MKSIKKLAVIMLSAMVLFGTMTVPTNGSCKITNKADFQHCVTEKENYNLQWKNPASGINCKSW